MEKIKIEIEKSVFDRYCEWADKNNFTDNINEFIDRNLGALGY